LLAYSAYVHSPTLNEPGHLVAGLSYWKFGRFDVYNVNPPLVKMVAALPVMAVGYEEEWSGYYEGSSARSEFRIGKDLIAVNGERSFFLFMIARWACIPFSWLGAIVCYLWARDLYGRPSAVLACALWCFEPNILAHAPLMTPDAHATALGLAACYTFWCWLKQPTWTQATLTGVVLGLAELTKTTLILFYPMWPLMWLVYRWPDRRKLVVHDWLREAGMLALRMLIGLYVLNLGYGFEGSFTSLNQYHFVSDLFTGMEPGAESQEPGKKNSTTSASSINRFASTWIGQLPVPFPKNYLLGIDLQQKDFEHYGRPSYLRGEWRDHGWWYYYLYACAIKVPLGLWALGLVTLLVSFQRKLSKGRQTAKHQRLTTPFRDQFILLFPAVVIFVVVSSKAGFSEHFRYVLPSFPFFFVWVSQLLPMSNFKDVLRKILFSYSGGVVCSAHPFKTLCRSQSMLTPPILITWLAASSLWGYPHSLSYFNESIGGPLNGAKHLLGSNVDWGQDFRYLKQELCHKDMRQGRVFVANSVMYDVGQLLGSDRVSMIRDPNDFSCLTCVDLNSGSMFLYEDDAVTVASVNFVGRTVGRASCNTACVWLNPLAYSQIVTHSGCFSYE
jgi:hypothetical protein